MFRDPYFIQYLEVFLSEDINIKDVQVEEVYTFIIGWWLSFSKIVESHAELILAMKDKREIMRVKELVNGPHIIVTVNPGLLSLKMELQADEFVRFDLIS